MECERSASSLALLTPSWGNLGSTSFCQEREARSAPYSIPSGPGSEGHLSLRNGTGWGGRPFTAWWSSFSVGVWLEWGGHRQKDFLLVNPVFCQFWLRGTRFLEAFFHLRLLAEGYGLLQQPVQAYGRKRSLRSSLPYCPSSPEAPQLPAFFLPPTAFRQLGETSWKRVGGWDRKASACWLDSYRLFCM